MDSTLAILGLFLAALSALVLTLFFGKSANKYMKQVNDRSKQTNVTPQDLIEPIEPPSPNVEPPKQSKLVST
jgi:hypothetical protein